MKNLYTFIICILIFVYLPAQNPGDLDLNYGTNGISIPVSTTDDYIRDIGIMTDDHVISGGTYYEASFAQGLLSYKIREDGSLAPYAGSNRFTYDFGDNAEDIRAVYVLPDNKILCAGYYSDLIALQYFVLRLMPDGTLDPTFGIDGIASGHDFELYPKSIGVHHGLSGEYSIYLCGSSGEDGDEKPAILKLDKDGNQANFFGTNGFYIFDGIQGTYNDIYVSSFSGNGYIYAGGYDNTNNQLIVCKHDIISGDPITSFGTDGIFNYSAPTGIEPYVYSLVFQSTLSNSTIAAFGNYKHNDDDHDIFAIRLNCEDGSLDNTFGVAGWSSLRVPDSEETIRDAILQSEDGKYYFGGNTNYNGGTDFLIGRLNNNGFLDLIFGDNGLVITDIDNNDHIAGLAINSDQSRLYAGGYCTIELQNKSVIASYHTGLGVGIETPEIDKFSMSVFPNPSSSYIILETELYDEYLIEIFSPDGKLIMQERQENNSIRINIDHLNKGIYFLKLSNAYASKTSKVIKY